MKEKRNIWLPVLLLVVFALTRWPGLLPQNFSAAYALFFCAGVFIRSPWGWWLPLLLMALTDVALNCYYYAKGIPSFQVYQLVNYVVYGLILLLGRSFRPSHSWLRLLSGGILGAILFYLLTNTAAWFFNPFNNPEYTKTLAGLITALTTGTFGWPHTFEFFRNTLLSGGLFTGLFVAAMKFTEATDEAEEEAEEPQEAEAEEPQSAEEKA